MKNFDPSVNVSIAPVKGGSISMDWNQANIAREASANQNIARVANAVGEQVQKYAIAEKDTQIKMDITSLNRYRDNLWQEAKNELEATPTINTVEKTKLFWEQKSKQIEEQTDRELKANGRWYDDCRRFVEAESRESASKHLLDFESVQVRKDVARNEKILSEQYGIAMDTLDENEFSIYVNMAIANGRNPEQLKYDKIEFNKNVSLGKLNADFVEAQSKNSFNKTIKAYETIEANLVSGEYGFLTKSDVLKTKAKLGTAIRAINAKKVETCVEKNIVELSLLEVGSDDYSDKLEETKVLIKKSGLKAEQEALALARLDKGAYQDTLKSIGSKIDILELNAGLTENKKELEISISKMYETIEPLKETHPNEYEKQSAQIELFKKKKIANSLSKAGLTTAGANTQYKDNIRQAVARASDTGEFSTGIYGIELNVLDDTQRTKYINKYGRNQNDIEFDIRKHIFSLNHKADKNGAYTTAIATYIHNNIPSPEKRAELFGLLGEFTENNGYNQSTKIVEQTKNYLTEVFGSDVDFEDNANFDSQTLLANIMQELRSVGASETDVYTVLRENSVVGDILANAQVRKLLADSDYNNASNALRDARFKANQSRTKRVNPISEESIVGQINAFNQLPKTPIEQ